MTIPNITINYFEEIYIDHILDVLRISREELKEKLDDTSVSSINKKAERYISTYLNNQVHELTEENWITTKELFIQWKLFEGIELEEISKDKKESLIEVLELFKENILTKNSNSPYTKYKKKIIVYKAKDNEY